MAGRIAPTAKRLFDLEIDEVSTVDRDANGHAKIAIAKRAQEDTVTVLLDHEGYQVDEGDLQPGDVVYDGDSGEELVYLDQDLADELGVDLGDEGPEGEVDDEDIEDEGEFGKSIAGDFARWNLRPRAARAAGRAANARVRGANAVRRGRRRIDLGTAAITGGASSVIRTGREGAGQVRLGFDAGRAGVPSGTTRNSGRLVRAGANVGRNRLAYAGGGAATVGGVTGYEGGRRRVGKSLGQGVLEELSKAINDSDRDQVVAKALDVVEVYKSQAEQALELASELATERELEQFTEVAKSYELPGDPEQLAVTLYNVAKNLGHDALGQLDAVLSSAGAALYDQIGVDGSRQSSDVMDEVESMAGSIVAKGDGELTEEAAMAAIFEADPALYDQYLTEQNER